MDKDLSAKLRAETAGCRLQLQKWGITKALNKGQVIKTSEVFQSDAKFLRASKRMIDTDHPAWKKVNEIRSRMVAAWKSTTLPYPEDGIRLIRRGYVAGFDAKMASLREEFTKAVAELQAQYDELKAQAQASLGELFCASDYPPEIENLFDVHWDYPNLDAPEYLKQLNPELYEEQKKRLEARFEEAIAMTESALVEEMNQLITHLIDRLTGAGADGKQKVFKEQSIENLREFFDGFKQANIGSNAQLDALVDQVKTVIGTTDTKSLTTQLRTDDQVRETIKEGLAKVAEQLDGLMVAKPRRKIVLEDQPAPPANSANETAA